MLTLAYILELVRRPPGRDRAGSPGQSDRSVDAYCPPQDGCVLPWDARSIWINPPYGEVRERWVDRRIAEARRAARAALLMPAATDTRTFQKAFTACTTCLFIQGRIKFGVLRRTAGRKVPRTARRCLDSGSS
jgi:DNA N-6-adenine-methyltransferase (Dam)